MSDNVLYFPYINVPQSTWLIRTLLYWDTVGVIMPAEFIDKPEKLKPFTRDLLSAGLLTQVFPGNYLRDLPDFSNSFLSYLTSHEDELERRQRRFQRDSENPKKQKGNEIHLEKLGVIPVHLQKLEGLAAGLVAEKVAKLTNPPWLSVEAKTAEEFMYYLALVLGGHKDVQLTPVTDEREKLQRLSSVSQRNQLERRLEPLRIEILEDILPAPNRPISVLDIENFKGKFGDQLGSFRRKVEMELVLLVGINNLEERNYRLKLFKDGCREEIGALKARMKEMKWPSIVFGKLCALLSLVPVIGTGASVINAAYSTLGSGGPKEIDSALAYAAYARSRLFHN